jgi:hypothetical protein
MKSAELINFSNISSSGSMFKLFQFILIKGIFQPTLALCYPRLNLTSLKFGQRRISLEMLMANLKQVLASPKDFNTSIFKHIKSNTQIEKC